MAVDLDLDLDVLIGESESPACEHPDHGTRDHAHADGDEHYVRMIFECGHIKPDIKVSCLKWLTVAVGYGFLICGHCKREYDTAESLKDLGPVSDYK